MFNGYDPNVNVFALTGEEIASDWRNGLLRKAGALIVERGTAEGVIVGQWGSLKGFVPGSLAEHLYARLNRYAMATGTQECKVVSVTDLEEVNSERYDHDSFGPGQVTPETGFAATVTCEHGVTGRMIYTQSLGNLIYEIASN